VNEEAMAHWGLSRQIKQKEKKREMSVLFVFFLIDLTSYKGYWKQNPKSLKRSVSDWQLNDVTARLCARMSSLEHYPFPA
jgi:hypothetical protein